MPAISTLLKEDVTNINDVFFYPPCLLTCILLFFCIITIKRKKRGSKEERYFPHVAAPWGNDFPHVTHKNFYQDNLVNLYYRVDNVR